MYSVRVNQLNCDKGTDNWNLVMKLTLDQETQYSEFKRLYDVQRLKRIGEISLKKDRIYYTRCLVNILGILERLLRVRECNHCYEDIATQESEQDSKSTSL